MPSTVTHSYFMNDVYECLKSDIKEKIILESSKTFAQGPDIFYFYNMGIGKKSYKYRKVGYFMHKNKVNLYFTNIIEYIKNNNLEDDKECFSFLVGAINHFVLDSTVHPFVYYNTGYFNRSKRESYKYNGLHQEMEYYLDAYMIFQNEKVEAKDYKMYKYILNNREISNNLIKLINSVIYDTYLEKNMGNIYNKCVCDMKKFFKYFNYDPYGIKKLLYTFVDFVTPKKFMLKRKFSFYLDHNSKREYLNLEKKVWNHPVSKTETYNYSFIELYVIAKNKCVNIINEIYDILNSDSIDKKKIEELFGNLSYTTGKNCEDRSNKLMYFKF